MERTLFVAIIDDDRDQCQTLADILEEFGCTVACCWEPKAAVRLCSSRQFDLIILDEALRRECLQSGADEVMLKPLDIPHLLRLADVVRRGGDCHTECGSALPA
jgi:DNA-binding response OmpR family regulator